MEVKTKGKREPLFHWITLIGHVFVMFVIEGYLRTYGLLYLELLDKYNQGPQKTGLIATVFAVCTTCSAPVAGIVIDRFGTWKTLTVGALLGANGAIIAAFAPTMVLVYVGYGCFIAAAGSICFMANTTAVTNRFVYNRTVALGIVFAGGSLGTMLYPLLFRALVTEYTFRGVLLILAGFFLNFIVTAFLIFAGRHSKNTEVDAKIQTKDQSATNTPNNESLECQEIQSLQNNNSSADSTNVENTVVPAAITRYSLPVDDVHIHEYFQRLKTYVKLFLTLKFVSLCLWYFTYVYAVFGYLMYFPPYARERLMTDFEIAALLSINGATDLVSRIAVGFLGGLRRVNIYVLTTVNMLIVGIATVLLPTFLTLGPVYPILGAYMALNGLFAGGIYGLLGQVVVDAVGIEKSGTAIGVAETCFGIAIGLPAIIYGSLKESTNSYVWVNYLSGASFILCAIVVQIGQLPALWGRLSSLCRKISHRRKSIVISG